MVKKKRNRHILLPWQMESTGKKNKLEYWTLFNSINILHNILYKLPNMPTMRICLTINSFFGWWLSTTHFKRSKGEIHLLFLEKKPWHAGHKGSQNFCLIYKWSFSISKKYFVDQKWELKAFWNVHFTFFFFFFLQAVFDPEIFFYVLLPPIIFYAGYDMKKVITKLTFIIIYM